MYPLSRRGFLALAAAASAALIAGALQYLGAREGLSLAVEFNDHAAAAWVALEKGWFEEAGVGARKVLSFRTGLELAQAMARGDVDAAWACLGPLILLRAKGVPVKVVAMAHTHGYALLARPEIGALEGKVAASPGPGSPCYLLLELFLRSHGVSGVEVKRMPPYIAVNALLSGQIDAAALPEHYATIAEFKGMRALARSQDLWPQMPGSFLAVREELVEERSELVRRLVRLNVESTKYLLENLEESAEIVAEKLGASEDVVLESMRKMGYGWRVDMGEVQRYIDLLAEFGVIEEDFDAGELVDLTFLEEVGEG